MDVPRNEDQLVDLNIVALSRQREVNDSISTLLGRELGRKISPPNVMGKVPQFSAMGTKHLQRDLSCQR